MIKTKDLYLKELETLIRALTRHNNTMILNSIWELLINQLKIFKDKEVV